MWTKTDSLGIFKFFLQWLNCYKNWLAHKWIKKNEKIVNYLVDKKVEKMNGKKTNFCAKKGLKKWERIHHFLKVFPFTIMYLINKKVKAFFQLKRCVNMWESYLVNEKIIGKSKKKFHPEILSFQLKSANSKKKKIGKKLKSFEMKIMKKTKEKGMEKESLKAFKKQ